MSVIGFLIFLMTSLIGLENPKMADEYSSKSLMALQCNIERSNTELETIKITNKKMLRFIIC